MEHERESKADIEAAVAAIMAEPADKVMDMIVEDRKEKRRMERERGTVDLEEAEEEREGELDMEEEYDLLYGFPDGVKMVAPSRREPPRLAEEDEQALIGYSSDDDFGTSFFGGEREMSRNGGASPHRYVTSGRPEGRRWQS